MPDYATLNPYAPPTAADYCAPVFDADARGRLDRGYRARLPTPPGYPAGWVWPGTKAHPCPGDYPLPSIGGRRHYPRQGTARPPARPSSTSTRAAGPTFTPVVGAPGLETRYPVDQLRSQFPDVFNMLIAALEAMQKLSESTDIRCVAGMRK